MKRSLFFLLCMTLLCACSSKDDFVENQMYGDTDKRMAAISAEEAISLLPYRGETISVDEVAGLLEQYNSEQTMRSTLNRNGVSNIEIIDNYVLGYGGEKVVTKSVSLEETVSFCVARFNDINGHDGISLVCTDRRFPEILAFVPDSKYDTWKNPMARLMAERAQNVALAYIKRFNTIRDSLQDRAIHKVCVQLNIPENEFDINRYMHQIYIISEQNKTKSKVVQTPGGTEISSVGPLCGSTRLIQGWPCNQFIPTSNYEKHQNYQYNGHFPVGCVNVALATICSYVKPIIYCSGLGRNINWENVENSYFNPYSMSLDQYDENTPRAIEVGHLMNILASGTKTEFSEQLGGNTYFVNAVSYMNSIGVDMSKSFVALTYDNVRKSLGNKGLIYVSGTETTKTRTDNVVGGHGWVIDGLQVRTQNTRMDLRNYNCYASCKFGWVESSSGTYNGWYLFDTSGTITFDFGDTELATDLRCITNIKKK